MKHSPGPWTYGYFENNEPDLVSPIKKGGKRWALCANGRTSPILIAGIFDSYPSEADAKLIAAAPDLLKMLNAVVTEMILFGPEQFQTFNRAKEILLKATTGE